MGNLLDFEFDPTDLQDEKLDGVRAGAFEFGFCVSKWLVRNPEFGSRSLTSNLLTFNLII